ncbi:hypothetical protein CEXT_401451 [Caerostris extrusa]|uniref:Uncharacterized protein n=1 Tax=Caerostris extrusa TaxID=172846 RepID=A0AAV4NJV0_CAEEX|nr:hypothetical protein CEXT_401451 [Caerostris extrusa]
MLDHNILNTLLILKYPTRQSRRRCQQEVTEEKNNPGIPPQCPHIPRTFCHWYAISPRMSDGAAENTLFCSTSYDTRGRWWGD